MPRLCPAGGEAPSSDILQKSRPAGSDSFGAVAEIRTLKPIAMSGMAAKNADGPARQLKIKFGVCKRCARARALAGRSPRESGSASFAR